MLTSVRRHLVAGIVTALVLGMAALVQPVGLPAAAAATSGLAVETMTTNGRVDPLGIPGDAPSFGWSSSATARDVVQSAYQVRVATSEDGLDAPDVWDSGSVTSDRQTDVLYDGPALASQTRYVWQVRLWDGAGTASEWSTPASFETGILDTDEWQGDWIGESATGEVDGWTDYTANIDFDIADLAIGVFIRAADTRNAYMWQISTADGTGVPKFRPHRRVDNGYTLLGNEPITSITSAELLEGTHRLTVTVDGSTLTTSLDGVEIDQRTDPTFAQGFVGFRQDFADGQGDEAVDIKAVTVTAKNGDVLLDTDFSTGNPFTGGRLTDQGLRVADRQDVLYRSNDANKPLLRTDFATEPGKTVASARVYASAQGVYELQLNGEKVGDQELAPGWTEYRERIQHQTYDVTDQVQAGENAFGAALGDGWWAGKIASFGFHHYGTTLGLIAQLRIDYTDGTSQVVTTDDTWTSHFGPFVQADNIEGETYDANAEQTGWDLPGFDDADWGPVTIATDTTSRLVPQPDEPVRATEELPAVEHTTPEPGVEIYDLGQNMVGVARLRLQGEPGQTATIRYGEELNPDGTLYTANLRSAKVTDHYTFDETGEATYTPTFTQHGFRYLEVTGTTTAPALDDVTGIVWESDLPATGDLQTSDPMLNQLLSNISWGQRGNFVSVPTDTPARDERLGWTGDINVFAPTASYLRDTRAFLGKWMVDLKDAGYGDGNFPGIAPVVPRAGDFGSGLGWSDAAITVPYATWKAWDDGRIVRDNYQAMADFLAFVRTSAGEDLIDSGRGHWDDWLNLDDPTPTAVLGTAYFAENARMMSEMAAAIGEDGDAADYAALSREVREAFTATLVQPDGTVNGNSQTGYAMALGMDMVTDAALREQVAARFVTKLEASDYHLSTGFLGTPWLLPALSSIDRDDLAYTMLTHTDYPSWGYEVENGATTMWERWNSIMPDGSFGPVEMNSFNHYAYGAVGDWMYQNIGGITPVEAGYRTSRIAPVVGGGLDHASGTLQSAYGEIATEWSADGDDLALRVEVPVNTAAEVVLPTGSRWAVTEGGELLDAVEGVRDVEVDDQTVTVTVGSGSYDFQVTAANGALGAILDRMDVADAGVTSGLEAGDLPAEAAEHLQSGIADARDEVVAAIDAVLAEDAAARTGHLQTALSQIQELRGWLAEAAVDQPVRGTLDRDLAAVEALLSTAVADALGLVAGLAPVAEPALPGTELVGALDLVNEGTSVVTDISARVEVEGWEAVEIDVAELAAGATEQRPVAMQVPRGAAPGSHDAALTLRFTVDGTEYVVSDTTEAWASVTSGVTVGEPTSSLSGADPAEAGTVEVPLANAGDRPVRVTVEAQLPAGWRSVPSAEVEVPAGGEASAVVPVAVPLGRIGGLTEATLTVRRGGVRLAAAERELDFGLPTPPDGAAVDHVDFGDATSEQAHALQAAPTSGTNTEAGYTRRYANASHPGSWYSVEVAVPEGQPFVLRHIETYDGARTKKYDVYVDGVLAKTQVVPRAESGEGIKVHDLLVDDPELLPEDGTARIRYEYPADASGFYDPSLADLWVLPVSEDSVAPAVAATVVDGVPGQQGWYRSPVAVDVTAADARDDAPLVEYGFTDGWMSVDGPVAVGEEGEQLLSFRATDATGNRSSVGELPVRIDLTEPATTVAVVRGSGVAGSDRARVRFEATDALSGVAATSYRIDGGAWTTAPDEPVVIEGYGDHVVEYASTDLAGNAEPVRRTVVTLADVEEVAPVVAPQVSGTPRFASTVTADGGSWNTKGLELGYQWLRDGAAVPGATGTSYRLRRADVGTRISVRVTASKDGFDPVVADSAATPNVGRARSAVAASSVRVRGGKARVTARVTSAAKVTGRVAIKVGRKVVARAKVRNGRIARTVRLRGRTKVTVRYLGSPTVEPSATRVRVRRR